MRHDQADAFAARARASRDYAPGWHPVLAAVEVEAGQWVMVDPSGERYAVILLLELGGERGYRVVTWAPLSADRTLIGYYRSLRAAARWAHRRYLAAHSRAGGINGSG